MKMLSLKYFWFAIIFVCVLSPFGAYCADSGNMTVYGFSLDDSYEEFIDKALAQGCEVESTQIPKKYLVSGEVDNRSKSINTQIKPGVKLRHSSLACSFVLGDAPIPLNFTEEDRKYSILTVDRIMIHVFHPDQYKIEAIYYKDLNGKFKNLNFVISGSNINDIKDVFIERYGNPMLWDKFGSVKGANFFNIGDKIALFCNPSLLYIYSIITIKNYINMNRQQIEEENKAIQERRDEKIRQEENERQKRRSRI